jgi:hypothetical protein
VIWSSDHDGVDVFERQQIAKVVEGIAAFVDVFALPLGVVLLDRLPDGVPPLLDEIADCDDLHFGPAKERADMAAACATIG